MAEYGKGLLEFIPKNDGQTILDLWYAMRLPCILKKSLMYKVLKPQGILVCEFGAYGNIATIENAFVNVCKEIGYGYKSKFNFPTTENFGKLLEKNGFVIDRAYDYDRPTPLLKKWKN